MPEPQFTWDLVADVRDLFAFAFMVHAFEAGTAIAVLAGPIGWFVVLRREAFAAHTLAVVGFPGASGAVLLGAPAALGYFLFAGAAAVVMAPGTMSGHRRRLDETAVVGTIQAFALALGYLFVTLGHKNLSTAQALLFGSFLGISTAEVAIVFAIAALILLALGYIGRPLLFISIDPEVAASCGVPAQAIEAAFIVLLGVAVAEASQITGSLLVFALLVIPAATAHALTARPPWGLGLAVAIALLVTWGGLVTSYYGNYPIGFTVTSFAFALLLLVRGVPMLHQLRPARAVA